MDSNAGTVAIGVGALGFGTLLVLSAYTKTPLFGEKGLLRELLQTGDARAYGEAVGKALENLAKSVPNKSAPPPTVIRPPGGGTRI